MWSYICTYLSGVVHTLITYWDDVCIFVQRMKWRKHK